MILAKDCQQKRPGEVFQVKKEADPEVLDTEYQAFLQDMGIKYEPKKEKGPAKDKPYVPPMGALDPSKNLSMAQDKILPIMYTNGSSAPGAASLQARALSDPQKCGAARVSLFKFLSAYSFSSALLVRLVDQDYFQQF